MNTEKSIEDTNKYYIARDQSVQSRLAWCRANKLRLLLLPILKMPLWIKDLSSSLSRIESALR
jgi:hypothetical protein